MLYDGGMRGVQSDFQYNKDDRSRIALIGLIIGKPWQRAEHVPTATGHALR